MYSLRKATAEDALGVVGVLNKYLSQPVHPTAFLRWESRRLDSEEFVRYVALSSDGRVVGTAGARTGIGLSPGQWSVQTFVDPAHSGRGIGTALYSTLEAAMHMRGAARVTADVREQDDSAVDWAANMGFTEEHRLFESTIDLQRWDPSRFSRDVAGVQSQGVRFERLQPGEASLHHLEALMAQIQTQSPQPFLEDWKAAMGPRWSPEGYTLAVTGDRWIGVTILRHLKDGGLFSEFTGVAPDWRGRGVALALKVHALSQARAAGAPSVRIENHTGNVPMIAVNRKLGYVAEPGLIGIKKAF